MSSVDNVCLKLDAVYRRPDVVTDVTLKTALVLALVDDVAILWLTTAFIGDCDCFICVLSGVIVVKTCVSV